MDRPRRHLKYRSTIIKSCSIRCNAKLPKSPSPIEYTPGQGSIFSASERSVNKQNLFSTSACSRPPPCCRQPPSLSLSLSLSSSSRRSHLETSKNPGTLNLAALLTRNDFQLFFPPFSFFLFLSPPQKRAKLPARATIYASYAIRLNSNRIEAQLIAEQTSAGIRRRAYVRQHSSGARVQVTSLGLCEGFIGIAGNVVH